jgi:hypothetical protein
LDREEPTSDRPMLQPEWRIRDHILEARTPLALRVVTLFGYDQHLHIDSNRRVLRLRSRRFWHTVRNELIPFDRIAAIVYGYSGTDVGFQYNFQGAEATDTVDNFPVGILLRDSDRPVTLFVFSGAASLAWDIATEVIDNDFLSVDLEWGINGVEGNEDRESRQFVALLRHYLGVPVRSGMHTRVRAALREQEHPCPRCDRPILKTAPKCVYCGSRFRPADQDSK